MNMKNDTKINITVENGTLSIEELKKLLQCIREIEQKDPKRLFKIWIEPPDKTVKEMEEALSSVEPGFPFKTIIDFKK